FRHQHQIRSEPHEKKQDGPYNGKQPSGRSKRRFVQVLKSFHAVSRQKRGESTHGKGNRKADQKLFPFYFHTHHPCVWYTEKRGFMPAFPTGRPEPAGRFGGRSGKRRLEKGISGGRASYGGIGS